MCFETAPRLRQLQAGRRISRKGDELTTRKQHPSWELLARLFNGGHSRRSHVLSSILVVVTVAVLALGATGCGSGVTTTSAPKGVSGSSVTATSVPAGVTDAGSWRMSGRDPQHTSLMSRVPARSHKTNMTYIDSYYPNCRAFEYGSSVTTLKF